MTLLKSVKSFKRELLAASVFNISIYFASVMSRPFILIMKKGIMTINTGISKENNGEMIL